MTSTTSNSKQMPCLICGQVLPKNSFLTHISEHLNYRQHKCQDCGFESTTAEEMADHEAENPEHLVQLYALRNPYMDRVCRFIYNDCDFGERNGGLPKVLKRKLISANDDENPQQQIQGQLSKQYASTAGRTSAFLKADDCALPSPKVASSIDHLQSSSVGIIAPQHHHHHNPQQQWIAAASANNSTLATTTHPGTTAGGSGGQFRMELESHLYPQFGEIQSEFPVSNANYFHETIVGNGTGTSNQSVLEKFIAEQQQQIPQMFQQPSAVKAGNPQFEEPDQSPDQQQLKKNKNKNDNKEVFENVQCLKCGQWVKGRGICLLYHMNTRHLKLPLYRCLACPRDFFYVTDTTAKNHIRSFHANDLSLLENNYPTLSKVLHNSRKDFFGLSKSERRGLMRAKKSAIAHAKHVAIKKGKHNKSGSRQQHQRQAKPAKEINVRERPQASSGLAGNSSHIQCNQCGEFVASIYSSQVTHMNTKHLHLPVYQCRLCDRTFEALGMSAAVMHTKSMHGQIGGEAKAIIIDRRDECLRELNEHYRAFFT